MGGIIAHMMVFTEEEHLRHTLGESYRRYCERTPRYLGRSDFAQVFATKRS